jgi:hypothetical protein
VRLAGARTGNFRLNLPDYRIVVFYRAGWVGARWQARVMYCPSGDKWFSRHLRSRWEAQIAALALLAG